MIKKFFTLALTALMCLSFVACSKSKDDVDDTSTVVLCESWDFSGGGFYPLLSPATAANYGFAYWAENCYDTLVTYDSKGEIVGELADTWTISPDGLTFTFHIRDGVKFSDGTALTADAVKKSYDSAPILLGAYNGSYGRLTAIIESTSAPDDSTFILTLTQPYYAALNDMTASNPLAIVNPKAFENGVENAIASCASMTLGTGAYMFDSYDENGTYTFVKNPNYWGDEPEVDIFKVKVITDNDAKVLALRNGEIDMITGIDKMSFDAYKELDADKAYGATLANRDRQTLFLGLNLNAAPFNEVGVRQAAAYAIDQQLLAKSVFNDMESAAETFFSPQIPHCNVDVATYKTDTSKAKELLEAAGWKDTNKDGIREKNGEKLAVSIIYTTSLSSNDSAMLTIKSQLEEVGFAVTLNGVDLMTLYTTVGSGEYDMAYWYTNGGGFDPSSVVTNMSSISSTDPISYQFSAFFKGGNDLISELDSTANTDRITEIYQTILTTINDQCLAIPISYTHEAVIWDADIITGYDFSYDGKYVSVAGIRLK